MLACPRVPPTRTCSRVPILVCRRVPPMLACPRAPPRRTCPRVLSMLACARASPILVCQRAPPTRTCPRALPMLACRRTMPLWRPRLKASPRIALTVQCGSRRPREAGVSHRPAEKPNVPDREEVTGPRRRCPQAQPCAVRESDPLGGGSGAPKSAKTPIAQPSEAVTTLATDNASSPAGENSVGQDVALADAPRRSPNLQSPREPLTPPVVDAVAVKGSIPEIQARSIVPTEISTARKASNSAEPQSVDGAHGSKSVPVAQPDGRGRSETSDEPDREANRDAPWRDSADHSQGIARSIFHTRLSSAQSRASRRRARRSLCAHPSRWCTGLHQCSPRRRSFCHPQ